MRLGLLLLLLLATATCSLALSDVFDQASAKRAEATIIKSQSGSGKGFGDVFSTFHALSALDALGADVAKRVAGQSKLCDKVLGKVEGAADDMALLHDLVGTLSHLRCRSKEAKAALSLNKAAREAVQSALDSSRSVESVYFAADLLATLHAVNGDAGMLDSFDFGKAVEFVAGLSGSDGLFRSGKGKKKGTHVASGMALQVLATALASGKLSDEQVSSIGEATKNIEDLLAAGATGGSGFSPSGGYSSVGVTFLVLRGALGVAAHGGLSGKGAELSKGGVDRLVTVLLDARHSGDVLDLSFAVQGLYLAGDNAHYVPLSLRVSDDVSSVRVTNVVDRLDAAVKVTLKSASVSGSSEAVLEKTKLEASGDDGNFALPSALSSQSPGVYELHFGVTLGKGSKKGPYRKIKQATRVVAVRGSVKGVKAEVWSDSESDTAKAVAKSANKRGAIKASYPSKASGSVSAKESQFLYVKLDVDADVVPQQVFVRVHGGDGLEAFVVATPVKKGSSSFVAQLPVGATDIKLAFDNAAGEYSVSAVIGSALLDKNVAWDDLASVKLEFVKPELPKRPETIDPWAVRMEDKYERFRAKTLDPVHEHTFSPEESGAPYVFSFAFTIASLAPLALLLLGWLSLGISLQIPTSAGGFMATALFQIALAGSLCVIIWYWIALNVLQALVVAGVAAIVLAFTGQRALKAHALMKAKSE